MLPHVRCHQGWWCPLRELRGRAHANSGGLKKVGVITGLWIFRKQSYPCKILFLVVTGNTFLLCSLYRTVCSSAPPPVVKEAPPSALLTRTHPPTTQRGETAPEWFSLETCVGWVKAVRNYSLTFDCHCHCFFYVRSDIPGEGCDGGCDSSCNFLGFRCDSSCDSSCAVEPARVAIRPATTAV